MSCSFWNRPLIYDVRFESRKGHSLNNLLLQITLCLFFHHSFQMLKSSLRKSNTMVPNKYLPKSILHTQFYSPLSVNDSRVTVLTVAVSPAGEQDTASHNSWLLSGTWLSQEQVKFEFILLQFYQYSDHFRSPVICVFHMEPLYPFKLSW